MSVFYERTENENAVKIVFRYAFARSLFMIVAIVGVLLPRALLNDFCCSSSLMLAGLIPLLFYYLDTRAAYSEFRRAVKEGNAVITGSKWSFSKPFTVEIKKQVPTGPATPSR